MLLKNRKEAGKFLAEKLMKEIKGLEKKVVYALPRGGVILGYEIAKVLKCPLSLIITRKIGHPYYPEYAIGAVTEEGEMILNGKETTLLDQSWLAEEIKKEWAEAKRRRKIYLKGKKPVSAEEKTAIIVDDGVATGLSLFLAIKKIKKENPKKIIIAVPVVSKDTAERLKKEADELIALIIDPNYLGAVGAYYKNFEQVEDREVINLIESLK
jgi:putative phosphoribosyl transferase